MYLCLSADRQAQTYSRYTAQRADNMRSQIRPHTKQVPKKECCLNIGIAKAYLNIDINSASGCLCMFPIY